MKYLILIAIKLYWILIPKSKRRECIFKHSCSNYVYDITTQKGFFNGIKAFNYRFKNCRSGFEIFKNPVSGKIQMILPNNDVLEEKDISKNLIIK